LGLLSREPRLVNRRRRALLALDVIDSPRLEADPERIFQVFSNLLGNAVKFTPEEGTITVRAARRGAGDRTGAQRLVGPLGDPGERVELAREILGARHRSFWLDGDLGGGVSWQRFIARLVAHGPVSELVPGSILQEVRTDYTILGGVADDVQIHMA